ncbi:hypothetical protein BDW62DRAFT_196233 [Aspergillus aurantiobrunneus]
MNDIRDIGRRLILLALLFTSACAHSWVEQLMVIAPNGTFVGSPGYPRGYVPRTDPAFDDTSLTYRLPADGKPEATEADFLCMDTQRKQVQTEGSPRLQASAGAAVALRFQENGHVTLPEGQIGKPSNRGTIYVYGTQESKEGEKLLDVHKLWNKDGTGGDGRGVLLAERDFDDGRCYQVNDGEISQRRQAEFPHEADQSMGMDLWCQADIAIPSNTPSGKPYTLYWVWDWPTMPGADPSLPDGKQEIYTTCMDVDVVDSSDSRMSQNANYNYDQSLNAASIPEQFNEIIASRPGNSTMGTSTEPTEAASSSPATTAASDPATTSPVATVTVTSFVTSVQYVSPTGSA